MMARRALPVAGSTVKARAINAASGRRPLVVLANLAGFDGSPESMRRLQLEYGAEIADQVYKGTYTPLYSYVPEGLTGAIQPLMEKYGLRWGGHFSLPDPMHFEFMLSPADADRISAQLGGLTMAEAQDILNRLQSIYEALRDGRVTVGVKIDRFAVAGRRIVARGVLIEEFNQYSTRRSNHEVMLRGAQLLTLGSIVAAVAWDAGGRAAYAETTITEGGATSGYSEMGITRRARRPARNRARSSARSTSNSQRSKT